MKTKSKKDQFDASKFLCQNKECCEYHKPNKGHVVFGYMGGTKRDTVYLLCKICGKYFSENKGTLFYRKKTDKLTIANICNLMKKEIFKVPDESKI